MISDHDYDYHKYADDTELSKGTSPDQFDSVQSCIQTCIGDVLIWMNSNKLKLNTDKTEIMPVGSASHVALVESECANISGNSVSFKLSVKYLGVHLDHIVYAAAHRQHLSCILSGGLMSPNNPIISLPKCYCKACRGNDHFSSRLL